MRVNGNRLKSIVIFCIVMMGILPRYIDAQETIESSEERNFYFYWGYNREMYLPSTAEYIGPDYHFTIKDIKAEDVPKGFDATYVHPLKLTIPQFNLRIGYRIKKNLFVSAGWDHMKYKSVDGQTAKITGYISSSISEKYEGIYIDEEFQLDHTDVIKLEHSDGFNLVKVNLEQQHRILANPSETIDLAGVYGGGIIGAMTWTNSVLFDHRNDDRIHFSGMGLSFFGGLKATFWKRFFIQYNVDFGHVRLWDVKPLKKGEPDKVKQNINYFQRMGVAGFVFTI